MNSGKSTALMQVAYNYEERGMRVLIMKPSIDTKGGEKLMSRLGVERRVDIAVRPDMVLNRKRLWQAEVNVSQPVFRIQKNRRAV